MQINSEQSFEMHIQTNPIPKKSAETILTKLLTTNGNEVVSAIKPLAIINGKIIFSLKFKFRTIASTIGVSISAAPSFANKAATTAPRKTDINKHPNPAAFSQSSHM